jgi:GxxExxY protein
MDANGREYLNRLAEQVVGATYEVANTLGPGFLEKVYERALAQEIAWRGLQVQAQVPISVSYKGVVVGDYCADLLVDDRSIVELKCVDPLANEHLAQTLNYLKATGRKIALLVNFQHPRVEWKRIVNDF